MLKQQVYTAVRWIQTKLQHPLMSKFGWYQGRGFAIFSWGGSQIPGGPSCSHRQGSFPYSIDAKKHMFIYLSIFDIKIY